MREFSDIEKLVSVKKARARAERNAEQVRQDQKERSLSATGYISSPPAESPSLPDPLKSYPPSLSSLTLGRQPNLNIGFELQPWLQLAAPKVEETPDQPPYPFMFQLRPGHFPAPPREHQQPQTENEPNWVKFKYEGLGKTMCSSPFPAYSDVRGRQSEPHHRDFLASPLKPALKSAGGKRVRFADTDIQGTEPSAKKAKLRHTEE